MAGGGRIGGAGQPHGPSAPAVGWHADPWGAESTRCYWDGQRWTYRPGRIPRSELRALTPAEARADAYRVGPWYSLACLLPLVLSVVLPLVIVLRLVPASMTGSEAGVWLVVVIAAGWVPILIGWAATEYGTAWDAQSPAASRWRRQLTVVAVVLVVWGVVATAGSVVAVALAGALGGMSRGL